jgi:hypothetical protein
MFDAIVANICTVAAIKTGCGETLKAAGIKTSLSKEIDDSEQEVIKYTTKEVYNTLGKKTVEYSIAAGFIANSVATKSVQFQTPLNIIPGDLKVNANPSGYDASLNWKWNLP